MRVITGSARGLKLETLEGSHIRPTLDRVKENIFNMIATQLVGSVVADVCCGSGALGIEALSRGAEKCIFIDNFKDSCEVAKRNIKRARVEDKATVECVDFKQYFKNTHEIFDVVLIDPPYNKGLDVLAAEAVLAANCLADNGVVVLQTECESDLCEVSGFDTVRCKLYGKTKVLLLKIKAS